MQPIIFLESGHKRKGEEFNCKFCGKKSIRRIKPIKGIKQIFCSAKCGNLASRKRTIVKCANCGNDVEKKVSALKNAKHGIHFCGKKCKDHAQSLDGDCKEIRPPHFGNGQASYRNKASVKKQLDKGCIDCPESRRYLLAVHHKDGDRSNNADDNLEVVCGNCHKRRHLKLRDGQWIFDYKSLTPRDLLSTV